MVGIADTFMSGSFVMGPSFMSPIYRVLIIYSWDIFARFNIVEAKKGDIRKCRANNSDVISIDIFVYQFLISRIDSTKMFYEYINKVVEFQRRKILSN